MYTMFIYLYYNAYRYNNIHEYHPNIYSCSCEKSTYLAFYELINFSMV